MNILVDRGFRKGIDFGGWFSQCDYSEDRLNNFIKEDDFATVAKWGFDHVRIPVDYNIFENEDGTYKEDGFNHIDNAFALCDKYNLKIVFDLHKTAGYSFDSYGESESGFFENEALMERFYKLWEEFAKRYGKLNDRVVFELLNEVTDKSYSDAWNDIAEKCIKRIRAYAPDTIILVGGYWNNSPDAIPDLRKPFDDKVIYNFHCYDPLEFTHQGAYWTDMIDKNKRIPFKESGVSEEYFEKKFAAAIEAAKKNNTSLYCGEYGIIDVVPPEDALEWFKCINAVFEKYNIPRSVWNYKEMDFGLSDKRLDNIRDELLKYL
jgi:aryl-phospho-beta-D-glucosidase BglC (GH1 family)